jgi:hypothetical protein
MQKSISYKHFRMKNILLLFLIPVSVAWAQPPAPGINKNIMLQPLGNVYLDADYLLQQIDKNDFAEIVRIVNIYSELPPDNTDTTIISKTIRTNSYLRQLLETKLPGIKNYLSNSSREFKAHIAGADAAGTPATGIAALSLFPARKIADGLGTFIAERFKEELTQRYLQAFRDTIILNDEKYNFSTLMPRTFVALVQYENVFDYRAFMTTLKEAFKDDLDNLAPNALLFAGKLKEAGRIPMRDDHFYLIHYLADFSVNKIPEGQPLTTLVSAIDEYAYKEKLDPKVFSYFSIAGILSSNLTNNIGNLEPENINRLLFNRRRLTAFSGLLLEKEKKQLKKLSIGGQHAYNLLNSNIEVIEHSARTVRDLRIAYTLFDESEKDARDVVRLSMKASPAIRNLLTQFDIMPPADVAKVFLTVSHAVNIYDLSVEQKYSLIITEALSLFNDLGLSGTPFLSTFKKYGLFISNVAQAETAQEVKEALDIAALPVGSYKIKRNSFFDISFNAYPGLAVGTEFRSGVPAGFDVARVNPTIAFTAPVGLGFSWGQVREKPFHKTDSTINQYVVQEMRNGRWFSRYMTGRSHTLFFSVLDIGAVTSFRLIDDDTETLPEFNWNNILAPGVYYLNGWKNSPLSMGIGMQYGPQLRKIEAGGTAGVLEKSFFSLRVLLVVDVPIFSFYTRTTPNQRR